MSERNRILVSGFKKSSNRATSLPKIKTENRDTK